MLGIALHLDALAAAKTPRPRVAVDPRRAPPSAAHRGAKDALPARDASHHDAARVTEEYLEVGERDTSDRRPRIPLDEEGQLASVLVAQTSDAGLVEERLAERGVALFAKSRGGGSNIEFVREKIRSQARDDDFRLRPGQERRSARTQDQERMVSGAREAAHIGIVFTGAPATVDQSNASRHAQVDVEMSRGSFVTVEVDEEVFGVRANRRDARA